MDYFVCIHVDSVPFVEWVLNQYLDDGRCGLDFIKVTDGVVPENYKKMQLRVFLERDGEYLTYKNAADKLSSIGLTSLCYFDITDEDLVENFVHMATKTLSDTLKFNYVGSTGLFGYIKEKIESAIIYVSNHSEDKDTIDICFAIDISGFTGDFKLVPVLPFITTQLKMLPFFKITKPYFSEKAIMMIQEAKDIC